MADSPDRAANSGAIGMPAISPGMNKLPDMSKTGGGRGTKDDPEDTRLGAKPDKKKELAVLERARKRMDKAIQAEDDNRQAGLDDDKFFAGDQWPADVQAQRNFDKRPCLTINKMKTFVHQITNDQRMNRPGININPVGDKGDPELAKMYAGLIRSIERDSAADIAYDTAFESAVRKGWGYWRVLTKYVSPNSLDQQLCIERIRNAYTVYLDPNHQNPDGSDAKWAFVTEMIPRDDFKDDWPEADPMPYVQGGRGEGYKNWIAQDMIRIAEYWEIENEKRDVVRLANGFVGWKDEIPEHIMETFEVVDERESDYPKVCCYKLTAVEVLEENPWLGDCIPIIKVIGDEIDIEGRVKLAGLIRDAKDPQRTYNYWITSLTEKVALQPKAPFVMEEGQVEGHESQWQKANTASFPYLLYKGTNINGQLAPPPQRQAAPQIGGSELTAAQTSAQDMMAVTGIRFDSTTKDHMYDESGRALRELRRFGDIGSFHYVDNLAHSLRHTGEILVQLIPKIYSQKQVLTILREDGSEERVEIDPNAAKATGERRDNTGKVLKIFNPTVGKYAVTVTTGPSYATKRVESAESMMDFVRAMPQAGQLVMDLIAKNQDWPGAEEFATRLAKALPPNLMAPDVKDIPPQVQAMMQGMQQQIQQLMQEGIVLKKALADQQAERDVKHEKNLLDFEAKVLATMQRADANANTHIGAQLKEISQAVQMLHESLAKPQEMTH